MATETPPPPPTTVAIPPFVLLIAQMLSSLSGSHWLRSLIMSAVTIFGTLTVAKQELSSALKEPFDDLKKKGIKVPKLSTDAIGKLSMSNTHCTATIVGPVSPGDAKLEILTAAHCIRVNEAAMFKMADGKILHAKCVSRDGDTDAAWLIADNPGGEIPYLLLADDLPEKGEAVFHQGFGIDKPGNLETGTYSQVADAGRKCQFRLNVSPGDSGGAIVLDRSMRIVSPVCCSTNRGGMGDVFGATPMACARIRPSMVPTTDEPALWHPIAPFPFPAVNLENAFAPGSVRLN